MKLLLTGLSHKTASIDLREKLALPETELPEALRELQNLGASEAMILSTCNRVEIALTAPDHAAPTEIVEHFLRTWKTWQRPIGEMEGLFYHYEARDAIQHLFRVAASLDSMVVGEPQILGQLKNAYSIAKSEGAVGGLLQQVLERSFSVGKRVRSETGIGEMAVSVSYAAVELARTIFEKLRDCSVMIVGSGKMGELAAKHLHRSGARRIFVTNRSPERAAKMAALFQGHAVDYTGFAAMLPDIDIVIASSAAPHYILTKEDMQRVIRARKNKPIYLIDIAVPRNIDPAVNQIQGVFLKDIDDLAGIVNSNIEGRMKQAEQAEGIVADEVERMIGRLKLEELTPTIISLQEQFENIGATEVARALRRMPASLTVEQLRQVTAQLEAMTKSIVNKIAHLPISALRDNAGQPEGEHVLDAIRKVFHLHD